MFDAIHDLRPINAQWNRSFILWPEGHSLALRCPLHSTTTLCILITPVLIDRTIYLTQIPRLLLATRANKVIARRGSIRTGVPTRKRVTFTPTSANIAFANFPHPSFPPGQNYSF